MNQNIQNKQITEVKTMIGFQNINQRENEESGMFGHQKGGIADGKQYKSIKRWLMLLSAMMVVVIFLLGTLVMRKDKTSIFAQVHSPFAKHEHNEFIFDYPTVGIPIPGRQYNNTKLKPEQLPIFDETFVNLFKPYNDTDCQFVRYGAKNDGGYVLCSNFFNGSEGLLNIGMGADDSFGCDLTARHPMHNYQYDCTTGVTPFCAKNKDMNYFSNVCVGSTTETTQLYTFHSFEHVLNVHNLTNKHFSLKTDCEGCEYAALKTLPLKYLDQIDNIIVEFHFLTAEEWGMLDIFKSIADKFVAVNYHNTNFECIKDRKLQSKAVQVSLVNKKLINLKSNSRSFALHPLNQIDDVNVPDCQRQ